MSDSSNTTLVTINVTAQALLKLNSTNYLSWRLQFQTLLQGYIDGTKPCLSQYLTTTTTDNTTTQTLNQEYHTWIHQDQLILNAIIGSITPTIIHLLLEPQQLAKHGISLQPHMPLRHEVALNR
jgi:hypothetical protein